MKMVARIKWEMIVSCDVPARPRPLALGVLAGGRGSRLGGVDKAWIEIDGHPLVLHWKALADRLGLPLRVSANRDTHRFLDYGLTVWRDDAEDLGPVSGLHALSRSVARGGGLLTVPVDALGPVDTVLQALLRHGPGHYARDATGIQPLVAYWDASRLRALAGEALRARRLAVRDLLSAAGMAPVVFADIEIENLNTPDDLARTGARLPR
ncbi:molybdenum cofactor guanylyltransferase [Lysobacter pythonis]|uniref:Molybdenum cofactor guanylyltransferase n=1 Tax=Solilutibacter pythonis TaxID=2483112 RepID=A0A3M2I3H8_9GAMM|nr:molybdenum cofactor guanylyltransferase [Lysobacter pythonis]RMH93772.1 molybdenum cofactor guanylyltransferase [Lysobacter pythonis]